MSKITALTVENFQRIERAKIEPGSRQLVVIGGNNGQGKTSVLDAITTTLAGKRAMSAQPVRDGSDKAETTITLDDGTTIRRTITTKPDGSMGGSLRIRLADGSTPGGGAQGWLDARMGSMTVDPLAFTLMKPQEQADTLRTLAGIDTSDIDRRIAMLRTERTLKGREAKRARGAADVAPRFPGAPKTAPEPETVEASAVLAIVAAADATVAAHREAVAATAAVLSRVHAGESALSGIEAEIADAEAKLQALRTKRDSYLSGLDRVRGLHKAAAAAEAAALAAVVDPAPARAELAELETNNRKAREEAQAIARQVESNRRAAELEAAAKALETEYEAMTTSIAAAEQERRDTIAAAALPVQGLGLSEEGVVTFGGVPFAQASRAEQMRVSMAIALAGAPETGIRVALIRDASLLDANSMELVASLAEDMGAQVWLERVGAADDGAIIIEDGGVIS